MRIEQLTFTRFIAAILIVIFHYGRDTFFFKNEYVSFVFNQANIGVSYFFVLSGFVMIIAYGNKKHITFFHFLKNRIARIYPLYMAIILLACVVLFNKINLIDIFLSILMIQSWVPEKALIINPPSWSLSVEFFFYLFFPLLINKLYSRIVFKKLMLIIITFWLFSQIIFHLLLFNLIEIPFYKINDIFYHPIMHLNTFLIGNLAGLFFLKYRETIKKNYRLEIFITLSILLLLLRFSFGLNYHNGLLSLVFALLIILISFTNDNFTKIMSHKLFVYLGELSYGIYILQFPIWSFLTNYRMRTYFKIEPEASPLIAFFLRLIILIIVAGFSYIFFEKPLRHRIKKLQFNT